MSRNEVVRKVQIGGVLCLAVVAAFAVLALFSLARPVAQLALAPVLLVVAWRIRIFSVRMPLAAIGFAGLGVVLAVAFRYSHVALSKGAFLVSTLSDQDLQQETKIYRDKMRRVIRPGGESLVGLYGVRITQETQARDLLDRSPQLGGVVWGSKRWMALSFQEYSPLSLSSFAEGTAAREYLALHTLPDLLVARSMPTVVLSHGDTRASIAFFAGTSKLWREVPQVLAPGHDLPEFDSMALGLGRMRARWASRAHLALPLWLAGTRHLVRALEQPELEFGELRCAVVRLKQAIKQCRGRANPQLEAVARSNYALALLLYADSSPKRARFRKSSFRQFAAAVKATKQRGYGALEASHNLIALGIQNTEERNHARRKR
jgi:hypothetical protein